MISSTILLIATILGFVGTMVGVGVSAGTARSTNEQSKELTRETNELQVDLMREQTKSEQNYNSVGAQMLRSMAAGVNPMLAAGAQPTSASTSSVPNLDIPGLLNPGADAALFGGQTANLMTSSASNYLQMKSLENNSRALDIEDFKSKVSMLKALGDVGGSQDWTSPELQGVIKEVFGDDFEGNSVSSLIRSDYTQTRIQNAITQSNLSTDEKKYLYSWLDEMTNARYMQILASTENDQTSSNVNRSIRSLNESKRKEIDQAILNMQEQWRSFSSNADIDEYKALHFAEYFDATVKKLQSEANISEQEAKYWVWNVLMETSNKSFLGFTNRIDSVLVDNPLK